MYQITCPKCGTTFDPSPIRNGTAECPTCAQRMHVQLPDDEPPAPAPAPRRRTGVDAPQAEPKRRTGVTAPPPVVEIDEEPEAAAPGSRRLMLVLLSVVAVGGVVIAGVVLIIALIVLSQEPSPTDTQLAQSPTQPTERDTRPVVSTQPEPPPPPDTRPKDTKAEPMKEPKKEEFVLPNVVAGLSEKQLRDKLIRSCVWIIATDGTKPWTGSGVVVDLNERLVLTSERVLNERSKSIVAIFPFHRVEGLITDNDFYRSEIKGGAGFPATVVRMETRRELGLIQLASLPVGTLPVRLAAQGVSPGQKIHTIAGNPTSNAGQWIYSNGVARQVAFREWQDDDGVRRSAEAITSDVPLNLIDPGSPVVDARGSLVGLNAPNRQARLDSTHIDSNEIREFLKRSYQAIGREWVEEREPEPTIDDADLQQLIKGLKQEKEDIRRRAATMLAGLGPAARSAVPELLELVRKAAEPDSVRQAARSALAEIGPPSREHVPELIETLGESDSVPARVYAADAIGRLGLDGRPALAALLRAARDRQTEVRRSAVIALGKLGPAARGEAFEPLLRLLEDKELDLRAAASQALLNLGKPTELEADSLKQLLADRTKPKEARLYAVSGLGAMGAAHAPALRDALESDPDTGVMALAAASLGERKVKSKEVGKALAKAVEHTDRDVRLAAVTALCQIGMDVTTLPGLLKAMVSDDPACRGAVAKTLPPMGALVKDPPKFKLPPEAIEELRATLTSPEPVARAVAAYLLGTFGANAVPAIPDLKRALGTEKNEVARREIICTLADLGTAARDAAPELREAVKATSDDTLLVQRCAALALMRITEKDDLRLACPVLARAMELKNYANPDPMEKEVHERAKKALARGGATASAALMRAYKDTFQGPTEEKKEARKATMQALAAIGPTAKLSPMATTDSLFKLLHFVITANADDPEVLQAAREAATAIYDRR